MAIYSISDTHYIIIASLLFIELVPTSEANLTRSLMYMFDMMMSSAVKDVKAAKENKNLRVWITVSWGTLSPHSHPHTLTHSHTHAHMNT